MRKFIFILITLVCLSSYSFAITEDDKAAIRTRIDETYKYVYYNPEPEARSRAADYINYTYFDEFIKCKNNCEIEWSNIRTKANKFSVFTNPETVQKEANTTFNQCMVSNCNPIKEIQIKECYDYIDEYIEIKNKTRKK